MATTVLLHGSSLIGAAATSTAVNWQGGRTALHLSATSYGANFFLQSLGPPGTGNTPAGRWVNINGTTFSADQVTAYDLPAGQYRLSANSSVAVIASLTTIPYGV